MASEAQISTNVRVIQNNFVTNQCELHACLRLCMSLCRWTGVFPVEGLNKSTCTGLRFNIKSLYVIYHIATLVGQSMLAFITLYYFFINDLTLHNLTNILFYVTSWLSSMCLLKLASNWPKLIKRVGQIESCVVNVRSKKNIPKKTKMTVCFLMISALFEHILSLVFKVKLGLSKRNLETSKMNETHGFWDFVKVFVTRNAPYVFSYITYSDWIGVLYEFVNFQATFLWNFTDAMTMCISIYLTSYFKDLYEVIGIQKKQNTVNWKEIRVYYSYLVELVNEVNRNLCYMILLSLFTDLFFIVVQLFYLLQTQYSDPEYIIYYSYSFLLLFARTMTTCLLAANVNTVARRPIIYLLNVSPAEYTIEVQRFIRQIRYTTTGLSGLYFYITRGMILTVIATVVKYELVLLQFRLRNFDSY